MNRDFDFSKQENRLTGTVVCGCIQELFVGEISFVAAVADNGLSIESLAGWMYLQLGPQWHRPWR